MFSSIKNFFLITILMISLFSRVFATQYEVIDLTPSNFANSYANGIGDGIQVGVVSDAQNHGEAGAWFGSSNSYIPMSAPANYGAVDALAAYGLKQAGYGYPNIPPTGNRIIHALLWSGPTSTALDLNPSGYYNSMISALDGTQQGGWSSLQNAQDNRRATLWSGSAASSIDLHSSFVNTEVQGVGGGQQVGYGSDSQNNNLHALLWLGSAASKIDLTPTGAYGTANATNGIHQVGTIGFTNYHAAMWTGTAASYQDRHPSGYTYSGMFSMSGNKQVGSAVLTSNGQTHAAVWSGTTASFQDINPAGYIYSSTNQINSLGWIIGNGNDGVHDHALLWKPVPEPGSITALIVGLLGGLLRGRKRN